MLESMPKMVPGSAQIAFKLQVTGYTGYRMVTGYTGYTAYTGYKCYMLQVTGHSMITFTSMM